MKHIPIFLALTATLLLTSCGFRRDLKESVANFETDHTLTIDQQGRFAGDTIGAYDYIAVGDGIRVVMHDSVAVPCVEAAHATDLQRVSVMRANNNLSVRYIGKRLKTSAPITLYLPLKLIHTVQCSENAVFEGQIEAWRYGTDLNADYDARIDVDILPVVDGFAPGCFVVISDHGSTVAARGKAANLELIASHGAHADLAALEALTADVDLSDQGTATVNVEHDVEGKVRRGSSLTYLGTPASMDVDVDAASTLKPLNP